MKHLKLCNKVNYFCSDRKGGYSSGEFSSLNLGLHVGDDKKIVEKNRQLIAQGLNLESHKIIWMNQTHSNRVVKVDKTSDDLIDADGTISRDPEIVCTVMTADCLPILLSDGEQFGAIHAGWKGIANGIIHNALSFFDKPDAVNAYIGAHIRQNNFEIGDEVRSQLLLIQPEMKGAFKASLNPNKWMADLLILAVDQLRKGGVQKVNTSTDCTYENSEKYFSYRRDGQTGRQAHYAWLNK